MALPPALADVSQSANYRLSSAAMAEGSKQNKSSANAELSFDLTGQSWAGQIKSEDYIFDAGFIPLTRPVGPVFTKDIPYYNWPLNSSKPDAFDLDDYFTSPGGYALDYVASGNEQINVVIDAATHKVSFSQPSGWYGAEKVLFFATDSECNVTKSNEVALQVENTSGPDQPVIIETQLLPLPIREGNLVKMLVKARDLDGGGITFAYSDFFLESSKYQGGDFWYSEAVWQTSARDKGHYLIKVTAQDPTGLKDTKNVLVNVGAFNHAPVLDPIADITVTETERAVLSPHATDSDNDAITYYFQRPFNALGRWETSYDSAGIYFIKITASDSIDTVSQIAKVTVTNKNRAPQAALALDKYTLSPGEIFTVSLAASDADGDSLTFLLQKDGNNFASGSISGGYSTTTSFSSEGYYKVAARVVDSAGAEVFVTKDVHVTGRKPAQPLMGDFNGDALTDLGMHDAASGNWEVCLSKAGIFESANQWLKNFGVSRDWEPISGDFNGDKKTDVGIYNAISGELKIALCSGAGFTDSGTWLKLNDVSYAWIGCYGNFNADKYTDFAIYNRDTGEVRVFLGTGSGFSGFVKWLTAAGAGYTPLSGDFNGDGVDDLCLFNKASGEFKVVFSNTSSFVDASVWISGYAINQDPLIADFNNDGLSDIGYRDKSDLKWHYAISRGDRFVLLQNDVWLQGLGKPDDDLAVAADFDGNGITDAAVFDADGLGITRWTTFLDTVKKPTDLLTETDNGIGGKARVGYTYASKFSNDLLPFPVYVVKTIAVVDTKPSGSAEEAYAQELTYEGGFYDVKEREFRGFAKTRITDSVTGNYTDTYFYQGKPGQDGALKGKIEKISAFDGNGYKISEIINKYDVKSAGPIDRSLGFPALAEQSVSFWEENNASITAKDKFSYDGLGNVIECFEEGGILKSGDERITATIYARPYETGFNQPTQVTLKDKNGILATQDNFEYDQKGNLTKQTELILNPLTNENKSAAASYTYDSFGNITSATNALGYIAKTDYETDFYTYPKKVTNALGHSVSYVYEPKFGVIKSITDANGNTENAAYDSFGRIVEIKNAYGEVESAYEYPDFNVKVIKRLVMQDSEYIDGLGRNYKTVSSGEDGSARRDVVTETIYDRRGFVSAESVAHYFDANPDDVSYIRHEYDIRGRLTKTIFDAPGTSKDRETRVAYIEPLYAETTVPNGYHRIGVRKDIYGNVAEVTDFIRGGVYKTAYEYDIQDNLTKITDTEGNAIRYIYDSLGRRIQMSDPDMGIWVFEYDLAGNLIKQSDAKGQVLECKYDALSRLIKKSIVNSPQSIVLAEYFYDDTSKENCIGRLSKILYQNGKTDYFYDKCGREIKTVRTVDDISYPLERQFDAFDRLSRLVYPDGYAAQYQYDANSGLLERIYDKDGAEYVKHIAYNAQGQKTEVRYGAGVKTAYYYGTDLRISRILTENAAGKIQDLSQFSFDKNGNLIELTDAIRSTIPREFTYDDLDRLTFAENIPETNGAYTICSYKYDSSGNMIYNSQAGVMTYGVGAGPHAVTSAGGYNYRYDANGNMVAGRNMSMQYDAQNRLTKIDELGAITTFDYGDGAERLKKKYNEKATVYIDAFYEIDSDGSSIKHIFADDGRICSIRTAPGKVSTTDYFCADHLNSSNIITDKDGNKIARYEYLPYGRVSAKEESAGYAGAKYLFTGKECDSSTGLYYYGARYYDPLLGRFITADNIIPDYYQPQSLNRYAYGLNNPLKYTDPTGAVPLDTVVDVVSTGYDAYQFARKPSWSNASSLAIDLAATVIPYVSSTMVKTGITAIAKTNAASSFAKATTAISSSAKSSAANVVSKVSDVAKSAVANAATTIKSLKLPVSNQVKVLNKVGERGNIISKATKESGKPITVIGSLNDTKKYIGKPGFNVFEEKLGGLKWTLARQERWLDEAFSRGDEIWTVTNPVKHEALAKQKGFISEFIKTEIPYIEKRTGISVRDKFK